MFRSLQDFAMARKGTVAIEYGLIVALIAIAFISILLFVGDEVQVLYDGVGNKVSDPEA